MLPKLPTGSVMPSNLRGELPLNTVSRFTPSWMAPSNAIGFMVDPISYTDWVAWLSCLDR